MPTRWPMSRALMERVRCAKHNWLDRARFKLSYSRGCYLVQTADGVALRFPENPYLAFHQIMEGYLAGGGWTVVPGMYVIDAGACQGEFAMYASAKVGPGGRVYVFEPDPDNLRLMETVFKLNGGPPANLVILREGLWDAPGKVRFGAGRGARSGIAGVSGVEGASDANTIEVDVQSIDSLATSFGIARLDIVKMDIEGAEVEAVRGATETMKRLRPRFTIASYHTRDGVPTAQVLAPLFEARDYWVRTGFSEHLTTYASHQSDRAEFAPNPQERGAT